MATPFPVTTEFRVTGAEDVMRTFSDFMQTYRQLPQEARKTTEAMREQAHYVYGMRRAYMLLRTTWRVHHAELVESMRLMMRVGQIGRSIVQMWQAWSIAQMRVESAARAFRAAQTEVVILQDEFNRLQQQGITAGEEYINMQIKLNKAKMEAEEASKELTRAQQENIVGYIGLGLQASGMIAQLADLSYHYSILKALHLGTAGAVATETAARTAATGATVAQTGASIAQTGAIATETVGRWGLVTAIWAQVKAQIAALATMGPAGWAILGVAAAVGATALAYWGLTEATKAATSAQIEYTRTARSTREETRELAIRRGWEWIAPIGGTQIAEFELWLRKAPPVGGARTLNRIVNLNINVRSRGEAEDYIASLRRKGVI